MREQETLLPIIELMEFTPLALKCDMREDNAVVDRLQRQGLRPVDYEDGLAVARRIRASRYLGAPNNSVVVSSNVDHLSLQNVPRSTTGV